MNSMEEDVSLCTTLQRVEEDSAAAQERALVAKENGKWILYSSSFRASVFGL